MIVHMYNFFRKLKELKIALVKLKLHINHSDVIVSMLLSYLMILTAWTLLILKVNA